MQTAVPKCDWSKIKNLLIKKNELKCIISKILDIKLCIRPHCSPIVWNQPTVANGLIHSRWKSISMSKTTDNI